jgi:hypothetical protein
MSPIKARSRKPACVDTFSAKRISRSMTSVKSVISHYLYRCLFPIRTQSQSVHARGK